MGRFSKLEPVQQAEGAPAPEPAPLDTRDAPGALGGGAPDVKDERVSAAEWMTLGDEAFLRGDWKPALRWYSRALDKDSTLVDGWESMIRALLLRGDLGQADTWTNRSLTLFPNNPALMALKAVVYARRGMLHQALTNSDAILAQHASDPAAQIARGEVLLLEGSKSADFCFDQAMKLAGPRDWKTPAIIGMIHEERRLWTRAAQFYLKAAERNEASASLWFRIARCRAELGQSQQARLALNQARELCPDGDPLIQRIEHARTGSFWNRVAGLFWKK